MISCLVQKNSYLSKIVLKNVVFVIIVLGSGFILCYDIVGKVDS